MEDNLPLVNADTIRFDLQGHVPLVKTLIQISAKSRKVQKDIRGIWNSNWFDGIASPDKQKRNIFNLAQSLYADTGDFAHPLVSLESVNDISEFPNITSIIDFLEDYLKIAEKLREKMRRLWAEVDPDGTMEKIQEQWDKERKGNAPIDIHSPKNAEALRIKNDLQHIIYLAGYFNTYFTMITSQFPLIIKKLKGCVENKVGSPKKKEKNITILHMPEGTKPDNITFRFKDLYTVDVFLNDIPFKHNISFVELGFQKQTIGKKKSPKPSILWLLLVAMSNGYSNPNWSFKEKDNRGRKRINLLNNQLQKLLNIDDDLIPLNAELKGYRPAICLESPETEEHRSYTNRPRSEI